MVRWTDCSSLRIHPQISPCGSCDTLGTHGHNCRMKTNSSPMASGKLTFKTIWILIEVAMHQPFFIFFHSQSDSVSWKSSIAARCLCPCIYHCSRCIGCHTIWSTDDHLLWQRYNTRLPIVIPIFLSGTHAPLTKATCADVVAGTEEGGGG